jgi:hypothetical protein
MIGIRECVSDVERIKDQHVHFVGKRVEAVIAFYISIFELLAEIKKNPAITERAVTSRVMTAARHSHLKDYKGLLNPLLKKKFRINNVDNAYNIKFGKMRGKEVNKKVFTEVASLLALMMNHYKELLEIDFNADYTNTINFYDICREEFKYIDFLLPHIFDYDEWFAKLEHKDSWEPYKLTKGLGLNACPYCNRSYIYTISKLNGKKVARPQLDHFLPKSKHRLLALSFFNLIPSCSICNSSIKGAVSTGYDSHISPYQVNLKHSMIRFTYNPKTYEASIGASSDLDVTAVYNGDPADNNLKKKVQGNIDLFCLNDLYSKHADVVEEIIRKRRESNDEYIKMIQTAFPSLALSFEDAYRLAYGNFFNESEFHKRPLAKLTKDIAIELNALIPFKP